MSSACRKSGARGLRERLGDGLARRERDAVHEEVQPAVLRLDGLEERVDLLVARQVAAHELRGAGSGISARSRVFSPKRSLA